jgi:hypothetical protein
VFAVLAGGKHERLVGLAWLVAWHVSISGAAAGLTQDAHRELTLLANFCCLLVLGTISLGQGPSWSLPATAFLTVEVAIQLAGLADPTLPLTPRWLIGGLFEVFILVTLFLGTLAAHGQAAGMSRGLDAAGLARS